jgi:hypothetical protein
MPTVVKIAVKDFNPDRLREQLEAGGAGAILTSLGWAGFDRVSDRQYTPKPARTLVGVSVSNGQRIEDFADPGELRFALTRDLTPQEDDQLTTLLANHDHTQLSDGQVRADQDEADLDAIIATERDAFIAALGTMQTTLNGWDAANQAQKLQLAEDYFTANRACMVTLGKVLRFILRRERGVAI